MIAGQIEPKGRARPLHFLVGLFDGGHKNRPDPRSALLKLVGLLLVFVEGGAFCHWAMKVNVLVVLCRDRASVRDPRAAVT
jgi:hypothetical protein